MDKGALLDRLGDLGEDRLLLARVLDRAEQARRRNSPAASDFLSPAQQALCRQALRLAGVPETGCVFSGGYDGAERVMALFLADWQEPSDAVFPLRVLRAAFREEARLSHRDVLGSLMAMGITREKVGDILVSERSADLVVAESVADFLLQSWDSAGRARLTVEAVDAAHIHIPEKAVREMRDTVSSLRLDAVCAAGFRMARGRAAELIAAGRVQVNWRACVKPDRLLAAGDTVSARGLGKLELTEVGGLSKKGRTAITVKRYI